jgi:hypothetical protein
MSGLIRWWRIYSPFGHRLASSAACVQSILRATLTHAANPRKTADRSLASLDGVSFIRRAIDFIIVCRRRRWRLPFGLVGDGHQKTSWTRSLVTEDDTILFSLIISVIVVLLIYYANTGPMLYSAHRQIGFSTPALQSRNHLLQTSLLRPQFLDFS